MTGEMLSVESFVWICLWQSAVLVLAGLAASFLLKRRSSRAHQVLLLSIVAAVIVPVVSTLVKHYELGVFVAEPVVKPLQLETEAVGNDFSPFGPITQDFKYDPGLSEGDLPQVATISQSPPLPWVRIVHGTTLHPSAGAEQSAASTGEPATNPRQDLTSRGILRPATARPRGLRPRGGWRRVARRRRDGRRPHGRSRTSPFRVGCPGWKAPRRAS